MARSKANARTRELGRIHILAKELGLDRDQYENVIWTIGRQHSSKDLDQHGRQAVITHLAAHAARRKPAQAYPGRPHNTDSDKRKALQKIEALLADAGKPWAYAASMARRMYGKDRLEFCGAGELAGIITALDKQAIKRLQAELQAQLGEGWEASTAWIATLGFGFDGWHRDVTRYSQALSKVARWLRGELVAACAWSAEPQAHPDHCLTCKLRNGARGKAA